MPEKRSIIFKSVAMLDPQIFRAMVADGIEGFEHNDTWSAIETFDELGCDYPQLRVALQAGKYTYAFYQQRKTDGDHMYWRYSTAGAPDQLDDELAGAIQSVYKAVR